MSHRPLASCAAATVVAALASSLASATGLGLVPTYESFEIQARSNIVDGYNLPANSTFNSKTPALNGDATIAFTLIYVGGGNAGLFVGAHSKGDVVYTAPVDRLLSDPSINGDGLVAMDQRDIFSEGVHVYDPVTEMTTVAIPATTFNSAAGVTIDDAQRIGFRAGTFGGNAWVVHDGASTTYVSETGDIAFLFTPSFDGAHGIAGKVRTGSTSGDSPDELRLYVGPGSFSVLAEDVDANGASPYDGFDNSIDLTSDGRIAFIANLVGGGRGVFLTDGTTTATIATTADPMVNDVSFFPPAANASGLVAFRGTDASGLDAVFVGDGTTLVRVIGEHDLVEIDLGTARIDQHDGSVTFGGAVDINEKGDIAFNASLTPAENDQIEWGSGMFVAYAKVAGDVNGDGVVDFDDLLAVLSGWGPCPPSCPGDLDGDGEVGFGDLLEVLANWTM